MLVLLLVWLGREIKVETLDTESVRSRQSTMVLQSHGHTKVPRHVRWALVAWNSRAPKDVSALARRGEQVHVPVPRAVPREVVVDRHVPVPVPA